MNQENDDKRRSWRSNFLGTVRYCLEPCGEDNILLGAGVDISEAGLCMFCSHPLREGQEIIINNNLPVAGKQATVRWIRKYSADLYKVGLEFVPS